MRFKPHSQLRFYIPGLCTGSLLVALPEILCEGAYIRNNSNCTFPSVLLGGVRGDLLAALRQLDEEEDVNKVLRYFSYEHFYVIYCKVCPCLPICFEELHPLCLFAPLNKYNVLLSAHSCCDSRQRQTLAGLVLHVCSLSVTKQLQPCSFLTFLSPKKNKGAKCRVLVWGGSNDL